MNIIKKQGARYWRDVLKKELISREEIEELKNLDPSPTKKHLDWLVKIWIKEKPNLEELRTYVEEFFTLVENNRVEGVDINAFPSFDAFKTFVDAENEKASVNVSELENDYEVIRDDADLFIAIPFSHEASRKLGLKYFGTRADNTCKWCTTYANASHFNSYFYKQGITFYYIKVRSDRVKQALKQQGLGNQFHHVALMEYPDGKVGAYDANDSSVSTTDLNKYRKVIGI